MMIKSPLQTLAAFSVMAALMASCSAPSGITPDETEHDPTLRRGDSGSFFTGRAQSGVTLQDITGGNNSGADLPINALLWRASLDTLSVLPLASVDTFGGTMITEWYRHPEDERKQIKIAAFILDQELRSDAIRAEVYVRERPEGLFEWVDAGRDETLARRLEDLILTRAREIRSAGVSESN